MPFLGLACTKPGHTDKEITKLLVTKHQHDVILLPLKVGYFHVENVPDDLLEPLKEIARVYRGELVKPGSPEMERLKEVHYPHLNGY
jgi:hypothetical protein